MITKLNRPVTSPAYLYMRDILRSLRNLFALSRYFPSKETVTL